MEAIVAGTIRFQAKNCPFKVIEKLNRDLSFPNPEYVTRVRMGFDIGDIPPKLECMLVDNGVINLPRGAASLFRKHMADAGVAVVFRDQRVRHKPIGLRAHMQLRAYQQSAIQRLRQNVQGYVVMPCGSGKSVVGAAAIAAVDQPALIMVHTRDLLEQWRATVRQVLQVEPGVVAQSKYAPDTITVATVQTLVRLPAERLNILGTKFGCVVVDEAHHAPASIFQTVLAAMPARYRFGLTATPERDDGLTPLLDLTFGESLFSIGYSELVADGFLQAPEVRSIVTDFEFVYQNAKDYSLCMNALVSDSNRNKLIVDLAIGEAQNGHTVLILSGRVEHCRRLTDLINERGIVAKLLVGAVKKADRQAILQDFRNGKLPIVVASTLADEGLDVPRLDRIILAFPSKSQGRLTQRLGRIMRPHPGKQQAILFDIADRAVAPLRRQHQERQRLYAQLLGDCAAAA